MVYSLIWYRTGFSLSIDVTRVSGRDGGIGLSATITVILTQFEILQSQFRSKSGYTFSVLIDHSTTARRMYGTHRIAAVPAITDEQNSSQSGELFGRGLI